MKTFIILAMLVQSATAQIARMPDGRALFHWIHHEDTNVVFRIYHSTNILLRIQDWKLIMKIPGDRRSVVLPKMDGPNYFFLTATNFWGK